MNGLYHPLTTWGFLSHITWRPLPPHGPVQTCSLRNPLHPLCEQTDMAENITFLQNTCADSKNINMGPVYDLDRKNPKGLESGSVVDDETIK